MHMRINICACVILAIGICGYGLGEGVYTCKITVLTVTHPGFSPRLCLRLRLNLAYSSSTKLLGELRLFLNNTFFFYWILGYFTSCTNSTNFPFLPLSTPHSCSLYPSEQRAAPHSISASSAISLGHLSHISIAYLFVELQLLWGAGDRVFTECLAIS